MKFLDSLFFFIGLAFISLFSLHGEKAMSFLFNGGLYPYEERLIAVLPFFILVSVAFLYTLLRYIRKGVKLKATICSFLGLFGFLFMTITSYKYDSL